MKTTRYTCHEDGCETEVDEQYKTCAECGRKIWGDNKPKQSIEYWQKRFKNMTHVPEYLPPQTPTQYSIAQFFKTVEQKKASKQSPETLIKNTREALT